MGDAITVACAMPNGIVLRVFDMIDVSEPSRDGEKTVKRAVECGRITLKGYWGQYPANARPVQALQSQYGLTHNVDKDLFDKWWSQNQEHPLVKNKVIFAGAKQDKVADEARDHRDAFRYAGQDPLDPSVVFKNGFGSAKDPRYPRRTDNGQAIEPFDRAST